MAEHEGVTWLCLPWVLFCFILLFFSLTARAKCIYFEEARFRNVKNSDVKNPNRERSSSGGADKMAAPQGPRLCQRPALAPLFSTAPIFEQF